MSAYLVRLIKSHDTVGFFTADDVFGWRPQSMNAPDVDACEYVKLPVGGVMWESPTIPVRIDARDDAELPVDFTAFNAF